MSKPPKQRTPEFKLKIALEALKGEKTIAQLGSENGLHPKQIQRWRNQLLDEGTNIFVNKSTLKKENPDKDRLINIINQLNSELEYLKKKLENN